MTRLFNRLHLLAAGMLVCMTPSAETAERVQESAAAPCGQALHARDVLVLDLRQMNRDPDRASEFVHEQAGDYRLANPLIQEFRMPFRPSGNPEGVTRNARKFGVRHGCDLVILLDTGPWLGLQRGRSPRVKNHGYALVSLGQRMPADF